MNDKKYIVDILSGSRTIVSVTNFTVAQGEITFLFGESGIGKSMLCKALYGLLDPEELTIAVNDSPYREYIASEPAKQLRKSSFFVFQEPSSHLNPLMLISEQLNEGALQGVDDEEVLGRLWQDSTSGKLKSILSVYPKPYRPSGGEKQRILLAMAFKRIAALKAADAQSTFFVFDEPTGSLDNTYRNLFLDYLYEQYKKQPFTAMIITHDYSIISEIYSRHKEFSETTRFRELRRIDEGTVRQHDFSAREYLTWLDTARPQKVPVSGDTSVLSLKSGFSIFNRTHTLYRDRGHTQEADLVIKRGEMAYVKAPSGVGKTTLAKIILGLYRPHRFSMSLGRVNFTEKTPRSVWERDIWGKRAGMIFQHADEALDLEATVKETFAGLPLEEKLSVEKLKIRLKEIFEGDITGAFLAKKVKYLSGGQKQRLNLLRTMMLRPDLIILDEPLNGLDFDSVRKVVDMLVQMRRQGSGLLMISHNEEIFDALVDKEHVYYLGTSADV